MPRPRKYDYQDDYPVRIFINVPVGVLNMLEDIYTQEEIEKEIVNFLSKLLENNRKKD